MTDPSRPSTSKSSGLFYSSTPAVDSEGRRFSTLFSPSLSSGLITSSPVQPNSNQANTQSNRRISPRQSPYSLLPFGSPLTFSARSVLNPVGRGQLQQQWEAEGATEVAPKLQQSDASMEAAGPMRVRMRGRDLYGGRVMYGGTNSTTLGGNASHPSPLNLRRHNRLLASTPYQSSMKQRTTATSNTRRHDSPQDEGQQQPNNTHNVSMSSTARVILETLEKMSTPIQDALKIPVPRAEKRRLLTEELRGSILGESLTRRRPRLGTPDASSSSTASSRGLLNGPPLRTHLFPAIQATRLQNNHRMPSRHRKSSDHNTLSELPPAPPPKQQPDKQLAETARPFFAIPALMASGQQELKGPTSTTFSSSLPGGKIRAKVTERAKVRAEKTVKFTDDEEREDDNVPSYLSGAVASNPFAQMSSLPSFQFGSGGQQKTAWSSEVREQEIARNQSLLTSPLLNPLDNNDRSPARISPAAEQPSTTSSPPRKPAHTSSPQNVVSTTPIMVMEKVFDTASNKNNLVNNSAQFVFSRPKELRAGRVVRNEDALGLKGYSFAFSHPRSVGKRSKEGGGEIRQQQQSFALPDLTAGAPSGFSSTNSKVSGNGFMRADFSSSPSSMSNVTAFTAGGAKEMVGKKGSVMDILGGNHKLPDVTAAAGLIPAKSLKEGSVMDILGKKLGTDAWQPNFNLGKKPWH